MKLFGLAGTNGSGKDTIAELLAEKYGFLSISATKLLGDELTKREVSHERQNKAALSAEWRRQYGMGVIVDRAVEALKNSEVKYPGVVVGSLRHTGETDRVHDLGGLQIWIDGDPEIRYKRIASNNRGRVEDQKTFEEFLEEEKQEMTHIGDEATLNMAGVKEKADIVIINNHESIQEFQDAAIEQLKQYLT